MLSVINEERTDTTYNFTVADYHTYHVTEFGVLVHNCLTTTKSKNGLNYTSHEKHLSGGNSGGKSAGLEPKNAFDLFGDSVQIGKQRYTIDSFGEVHRFSNSNNVDVGWHWSGGTADLKEPLKLNNKVKAELKKLFPEQKKNKLLQ